MKIRSIYAGSWVPRTALHLGEFYQFLALGKSHLNLDRDKLTKLKKDLKVENLVLADDSSEISAQLDNLTFNYQENGLIVFGKKVEKLEDDMKYLGDFSLNKIFPAFSYLYSLGAPIPKIFTAIFSVLPFIVTVDSNDENEVRKIFADRKKEIEKIVSDGKTKIYFSNELIVINSPEDDLNLIKKLIFIEDCRSQFNKILNLHRFIWEEVDKIKGKNKLPYKNLALTRDSLMDLDNEVIFLSSRLSQIIFLLSELKTETSGGSFAKYLSVNLSSLDKTGNYLTNLWQMTESRVKSTQDLIASLYQENTQRQLNILQVIFIISAMASIIALGSIYGFEFKAYDAAGQMVYYGDTTSFTFFDLARFGLSALLAGISIYSIFFFIYNKISYSKITSEGSLRSKELEGIKKMFR